MRLIRLPRYARKIMGGITRRRKKYHPQSNPSDM
jgi:hypothetical protein